MPAGGSPTAVIIRASGARYSSGHPEESAAVEDVPTLEALRPGTHASLGQAVGMTLNATRGGEGVSVAGHQRQLVTP